MATSKTELRKLFINDLRSGRFKKTVKKLKTGDGQGARYCLLGVATDRYLKEFGAERIAMTRMGDGTWVFTDRVTGLASTGSLLSVVRDAYGFHDSFGSWTDKASGKFFTGKDVKNCVDLNDGTPLTFSQMATFIEANPGIWKD